MRRIHLMALVALAAFLLPGAAFADDARCSELFPGVTWTSVAVDGPMTLATAGMNDATAQRFGGDVERITDMVDRELGGLDGAAVCLATADQAAAFADLAAPGQRLHVGVLGEERILVLSAVEVRLIDDALAFGIPHLALWQVGDELGLDDGYPDPLGSTIAHWYLARYTDRLDQYRVQLNVSIFLDDPNPEQRTLDEAMPWVGESKPDPFYFDPQLISSQLGVFIDYAVAEEGSGVLREPSQDKWAELENRWRISIRDGFPRGDFGVWWGLGIVVVVLLLAALLAWLKHRENKLLKRRRPTPAADEELFAEPPDS